MQHKSLTASDVEFPETWKCGTNLEGLFSFTLLLELRVCPSLWAPNNAELSQKTLPTQQAGQKQEFP